MPALPLLQFLPKDWIMEKWEEGYYITAMAGEQCRDGVGWGGAGAAVCRTSGCACLLAPRWLQWQLRCHRLPAFSLSMPLCCPSSCAAGSATGSSLVVMSKGTPYTQQSYKVSGEQWAGRQSAKRLAGFASSQAAGPA